MLTEMPWLVLTKNSHPKGAGEHMLARLHRSCATESMETTSHVVLPVWLQINAGSSLSHAHCQTPTVFSGALRLKWGIRESRAARTRTLVHPTVHLLHKETTDHLLQSQTATHTAELKQSRQVTAQAEKRLPTNPPLLNHTLKHFRAHECGSKRTGNVKRVWMRHERCVRLLLTLPVMSLVSLVSRTGQQHSDTSDKGE